MYGCMDICILFWRRPIGAGRQGKAPVDVDGRGNGLSLIKVVDQYDREYLRIG